MQSSYKPEDVTILLKDITGQVQPMESWERERFIQQGVHYSEMLPREHAPSEAYLAAYYDALHRYAKLTAQAVAAVSKKIVDEKGPDAVLVSLARAGTPIGILIRHYCQKKLGVSPKHYTISIIRGRGIDDNAMRYILQHHAPESIQFVDGWTGKGAIQRELNQAMAAYPGVDPSLAVLSDPANMAGKYGTREDFLIASSCLNATVSGLISRTFYRTDLIGPEDFHGAMYYEEFADQDLTYEFIDCVEQFFDSVQPDAEETAPISGMEEVQRIAAEFSIADINLIKPSIGETTRVLLRRVPWKVLVHSLEDQEHLGHIYQLAKEKGVPVEVYPLKSYKACGLIKKLADN